MSVTGRSYAPLEREGRPEPDGLGAIRVLGVNPARPSRVNREEVVAYDAPSHFGYQLLSGQPSTATALASG
jgi:hypothetical protein